MIHDHPVRWDCAAQVWYCSAGCGFARERRPGEVCQETVYGREYLPYVSRKTRIPYIPPIY